MTFFASFSRTATPFNQSRNGRAGDPPYSHPAEHPHNARLRGDPGPRRWSSDRRHPPDRRGRRNPRWWRYRKSNHGNNHAAASNLHIMGNLRKLSILAVADDRVRSGSPVDRGIGADFHIGTDQHPAQLAPSNARPIPWRSEAILTDPRAAVDDRPGADHAEGQGRARATATPSLKIMVTDNRVRPNMTTRAHPRPRHDRRPDRTTADADGRGRIDMGAVRDAEQVRSPDKTPRQPWHRRDKGLDASAGSCLSARAQPCRTNKASPGAAGA